MAYSAPEQDVRLTVVEAPPDRVRFEIEDRGPGIPEFLLECGFEAFSPGPDRSGSRRGLGLGLPMARAIVEQHGGHFGIVSQTGRGTEVFLSFPSATAFREREAPVTDTRSILSKTLSEAESVSAN
jgi:signal transduction histidine kinase